MILLSACAPVKAAGSEAQVITHPDGPLYVGDQISFEVLLSQTGQHQNDSVEVSFNGQNLGSAKFAPFGIGAREEAALWWVWNTDGLKPGSYSLTFTRSDTQATWEETYTLLPESQVPPPQPQAHWAESVTECCVRPYITGTAAARDIATLTQVAQTQSDSVAKLMDHQLGSKIDLTLMSRDIGQGGFTTNSVYVSYLDDNYMGNETDIIFHHEFVHFYDGEIGGTYRPSIFEEGLAVYLTGGHFKPEPLQPRGAALLDLGWYIPMKQVADDFYHQQHEIGYLEAATLVKYLIDKYGEAAFFDFYRTIPAPKNQKDSEVIDLALQQHFHISFADLESAYLSWLKATPFTPDERTDLRLTVNFFDTMRRYQKALDPSAYFLTAWLPDGAVMRQRGIVADFLRRPSAWQNQLVEFFLVRAQKQLFSQKYAAADQTLKFTNLILGRLGD